MVGPNSTFRVPLLAFILNLMLPVFVCGAQFDEAKCCPLLLKNDPRAQCLKDWVDALYECAGELEECDFGDVTKLNGPEEMAYKLYGLAKCAQPQVEERGCEVGFLDATGAGDPCLGRMDYRLYCPALQQKHCLEKAGPIARECVDKIDTSQLDSSGDQNPELAACEVAKCELMCECATAFDALTFECLPDIFQQRASPDEVAAYRERVPGTPEDCKAKCANPVERRQRNHLNPENLFSAKMAYLVPHKTQHRPHHLHNMRERVKLH